MPRFTWVVLSCLAVIALPARAAADRDRLELRELADPRSVGMDPSGLRRIDKLINDAIKAQVTPGVALAIGRGDQLVRLRGYGRTDYAPGSPQVDEHTLYDLASLTKTVATTSAAMLLVQQGRLDLDRPLREYLFEWQWAADRADMTVRHLLNHTSGLPAGGPLKGVGSDRTRIPEFMAQIPLRARPGESYEYSDYGMILLGAVVERIAQERLDTFLQRHLWQPAGLSETGFLPMQWSPSGEGSGFQLATNPLSMRSRIAPTERTPERGHIWGQVHDPLAYRLQGVAGNAGLFSSAHDLALFAQAMLGSGRVGETQIFTPEVLKSFTTPSADRARYALGWELAREGGPAGSRFPATAFGHTGFTGTSIWIDPEHGLYVVLLTNRLDPNANESRHIKLRRDVHDAVQKALLDGKG